MDEIIKSLYSQALPSSRTGLFYNTFAYPTKIAPESIAVYIATHTQPGDTVMDVFGGSGSTGLAALMCEHPTQSMLEMAKKMNVAPVWGARNAVLYEIGSYGAFASQVMTHPPAKKEFSNAVRDVLLSAEEELNGIYRIEDESGNEGTIRHIVWSDVLRCPACGKEFSYYKGMVRSDPMRILDAGECPHCGNSINSNSIEYVCESVDDQLLQQTVTRRKRVPAKIYGKTGAVKWCRDATESDVALCLKIESMDYPATAIPRAIEWGELYRSGYHKGITHLHHFYTKRNYTVMSFLWNKASEYPDAIRDAIWLLLLSYNATHATLMTRVVVKKNSKDFVLTGAQSGVLYISSLPVEKNILTGIKRKLEFFEKAFEYVSHCSGHVEVINASSQKLSQPDCSIDYVFTDPPFGDFIPYAEVNQINELWLPRKTDRASEIIISSSQKKDVSCYQKMMTQVFSEVHRVLRDKSNATVVFHASKAAVWNALCAAYSDAGFMVETTSFLDKKQASFKQVVSDGSVQGDPLILLAKGSTRSQESAPYRILDEAMAGCDVTQRIDKRHVYADYINRCLERGLIIELDAKAAYAYISNGIGATV